LQEADGRDYIGEQFLNRLMRLRAATCFALVVSLSPLSLHADARSDAKVQVSFGIAVAQRGLWREAIYRWEQAVRLDPTYAAAFNDLAVAYEHTGEFEKARQAYEKALELDPDNLHIRQNYDLFREVNDRVDAQKSNEP
jgi:Flp pilus assembly protein TadD